MVNKLINNKIFLQKSRDYTFAVMFLVVFSIFIFFAIRPSLITAFSLKKEESDLKKIDNVYENEIKEILKMQSLIEQNRDRLYLLDQSLSNAPQVNKIISDISNLAVKNSFLINKANIGEVNLIKNNNKDSQTLELFLEGTSDFTNLVNFINGLTNQRRLKTIKKMTISKNTEATTSSQLKINLEIIGYFL